MAAGDLMIGGDLVLYGAVGGDFWDESGFTAAQVVAALAGREGDLTVRVNSYGGIATEGAAIHAVLAAYPGRKTVRVEGIAASAASLIAMAGDEIVMTPGALMMVHDPAGWTMGNAEVHRDSAEMLDKMGDTYAAVYAKRTGMTVEKARAIMRAETWFSPEDAVAAGFATAVAEDALPMVAAAFDYTVFARAPEQLRTAATLNGWRRQSPAARAAFNPEEHTMTVEPKAAALEPAVTAPAAAPAPEMKADPAAARAVALARRRDVVTARFGDDLTARQLEDIVATAADDAAAVMAAADIVVRARMERAGPETRMTAHIVRDERETRREGMEAALVARLQRKSPDTDKANAFMGMSLAEMAATSIDYRAPLRTLADRERVLMQAVHSVSDFPALFENALNKELARRYTALVPTYRSLARQKTFMDFRAHPVARPGDFPKLQSVAEGGEIKFSSFTDSKENVSAAAYAVGVRISRQMIVNDDLDSIADVLGDQGRMVAHFEDELFYTSLTSGTLADGPTLLTTTRQMFNTTDANKAGTATAITIAAVGLGRAAMMKIQSKDGVRLGIRPRILLCGPDKLTEAQQIVAQNMVPSASTAVNPFAGSLEVISTPWLTGNVWYLFADPAEVANYVYGYLSGYEAPRLRTDEPFGMQGMSLTLEHDFGIGAIDWRAGYKNAGA